MPRLFVAIRPPAPVRDSLIDTMEGVEAARWQDEDQLHLTLRFVGEVDHRGGEDLAAALDRICAPPFSLALHGVGTFEMKRRVHTLWAGVADAPELRDLQKKIERACQSCGFEPVHRKFMPHVTVARLNGASGEVGRWLAEHGRFKTEPWTVEEFRLYRSVLSPGGSFYEPVLACRLRE